MCLLELSRPDVSVILRPLDERTECEWPCECAPCTLEEWSLGRRLLDGSRLLVGSWLVERSLDVGLLDVSESPFVGMEGVACGKFDSLRLDGPSELFVGLVLDVGSVEERWFAFFPLSDAAFWGSEDVELSSEEDLVSERVRDEGGGDERVGDGWGVVDRAGDEVSLPELESDKVSPLLCCGDLVSSCVDRTREAPEGALESP